MLPRLTVRIKWTRAFSYSACDGRLLLQGGNSSNAALGETDRVTAARFPGRGKSTRTAGTGVRQCGFDDGATAGAASRGGHPLPVSTASAAQPESRAPASVRLATQERRDVQVIGHSRRFGGRFGGRGRRRFPA